MLTDKDVHAALGALRSSLALAAQHPVRLANDSGGNDNISVILVRVLGDRGVPSGWFSKV